MDTVPLVDALRRGVGFLYLRPGLNDPELARLGRLLLMDHAWRDTMAIAYEPPDLETVPGDRMLQLKAAAFWEHYFGTEQDLGGAALGSAMAEEIRASLDAGEDASSPNPNP